MNTLAQSQVANSRFTPLREIGRGALTTVVLTQDNSNCNAQVALKILPANLANDAKLRTRFMREADIAISMQHPHIVRAFAVHSIAANLALEMEFLGGGTLKTTIAKHGALPPEQIRTVAIAIANALDFVHQRGIIHGDVKPANILLDDCSEPKLSDFGNARLVCENPQGITAAGSIATMAPEQLDRGLWDVRTDIYALGATLYELVTAHPFAPEFRAHLLQNPTQPLNKIIAKCLDPNPESRFQNAAHMLKAVGGGQ